MAEVFWGMEWVPIKYQLRTTRQTGDAKSRFPPGPHDAAPTGRIHRTVLQITGRTDVTRTETTEETQSCGKGI